MDDVKSAMDVKQGSDLGGRALYLDYVGKKSSFSSGGRGDAPRSAGGRSHLFQHRKAKTRINDETR